ncbi:hypothetical protein GCM10025876_39690 [Demequina litorisediminis]|uniref:PdxS/SNZ N-terminal domain-containing protein n=1 Tax=Demequina litorisediminis TaxID=1849022 RepID=A0ABQ6IIN2_9MICO|nr:hypothetical protein GCM10025876_39690 [Demequina litorisediminis]
MAAGAAVVASDLVAFRDVATDADGEVGAALHTVGDSVELAARVTALLDDPQARAALAERGQQRALTFDWQQVAPRIEETYRDAIRLDAEPVPAGGFSTPPHLEKPKEASGMSDTAETTPKVGTDLVKRGMAEMLKGGVIMDVVTPEQAKIAEDAGAVAVMALERVPADIRAQGGVARMSDPDLIAGIIDAVSIPVMAKARIGHFVEAQVLQSLGVDYIDESEVLTPADYAHHIDKWQFTVPFVCGATNLGEALRRISEGAAMIRSKGEAGTGDVSNATTHMRTLRAEIARLTSLPKDEAVRRRQGTAGAAAARAGGRRDRQAARRDVHRRRHRHPADAAMMMQARRRGRVRGLRHLQVR